MNAREHWRARNRRVASEREIVAWELSRVRRPLLPCTIVLTRIGPTNGLDPFDNLPSALKGVADQIAAWFGVSDSARSLLRFQCAQERGKQWAVRIEVKPSPLAGPQGPGTLSVGDAAQTRATAGFPADFVLDSVPPPLLPSPACK